MVHEPIFVICVHLGHQFGRQDTRRDLLALGFRFQLKRDGENSVKARTRRFLVNASTTRGAKSVLHCSVARNNLDQVLSLTVRHVALDSNQVDGAHSTSATTSATVAQRVEQDVAVDGKLDLSAKALSGLLKRCHGEAYGRCLCS